MTKKELIGQAREINLVDYLERHVSVKQDGQHHVRYAEGGNNIVISRRKNKYYDNQTQKSGDAINFLQDYLGYNFPDAIKELTGISLDDVGDVVQNTSKIHQKVINYKALKDVSSFVQMPAPHGDANRVWAYLHKTRCLPSELVNRMIAQGLVYQDVNGNAVFPYFDDGVMVGGEKRGTGHKVYKGMIADTAADVGWRYSPSGSSTIKYAIFFESPIDALSYYALKSANKTFLDVVLVSMGGLKAGVIKAVKDDYRASDDVADIGVYLGVDNDSAGASFAKSYSSAVWIHPPSGLKDWNEVLCKQKVIG